MYVPGNEIVIHMKVKICTHLWIFDHMHRMGIYILEGGYKGIHIYPFLPLFLISNCSLYTIYIYWWYNQTCVPGQIISIIWEVVIGSQNISFLHKTCLSGVLVWVTPIGMLHTLSSVQKPIYNCSSTLSIGSWSKF